MSFQFSLKVCTMALVSLCAASSQQAKAESLTTLPSGQQIKIQAVAPLFFHGGQEKALMLRYQTDKSLSDKQALANEADDIWDLFQVDVEKGGYTSALISALGKPKGNAMFSSSQGFNFVLIKNASGQWRCSNVPLVTVGSAAKIAYRKACKLAKEGQLKAAIVEYDKSIALNPHFVQAYCNRGRAHIALKLPEPAIKDLTRAISLNPACGEAYVNRGYVNYALRKYQNAIADSSKGLSLTNNQDLQAVAWANRGEAYVELGQFEKGIEDLNKAIGAVPRLSELYRYRGIAYDKLGKVEQAEKDKAEAKLLAEHHS